MHRVFCLGFGIVLLAVADAVATPMIVVGQHDLLANTADQPVRIMVSGADEVQGLNFRAQVADGGTHPDIGGSIEGPRITDVDLVSGTIFDGNTMGQSDVLSLPQISVQAATTSAGTVMAEGLLATVTLDTTGFFEGTFGFSLADTRDGATDFAGIPIGITDGSIRIVPEPSAAMLLLAAAALLPWFAFRTSR